MRLGPKEDILLTGLSSVPDNELELDLGIEAVRSGFHGLFWRILIEVAARTMGKRKVGNASVIVASPLEKEEAVDFGFKMPIILVVRLRGEFSFTSAGSA